MKFSVERKSVPYGPAYTEEDYAVARNFAVRIHNEFGVFIKAVVLFGGQSKTKHLGDIDILIVVDNVSLKISPEITETYRIITEKIASETSPRLHITTLRFTSFWEYIRIGDPVGINILRTGVALIDTGFFYPMQMMLHDGRIRPSAEAVAMYNQRCSATLLNSQNHLLQAVVDLYWAAIDSAHAAVMSTGEMPPAPSEMAETIGRFFVPRKAEKKHVKLMDTLYKLSKEIIHRDVNFIEGKKYDALFSATKDFVKTMKGISK